jgi:hypothetical protein
MKRCALLGLLLVLMNGWCWAARIHLADGSIVESEKVWRSDGFVHFILSGTQSVEIRYSEKIVTHIEGVADQARPNAVRRFPQQEGQRAQPPATLPTAKRVAPAESQSANQKPMVHAVSPPNQSPKPSSKTADALYAEVAQFNEVNFYDPRRPLKYWASSDIKTNSLNSAIKALAEKYRRTPQWVETHMGKSNNLGQIHRNLIAHLLDNNSTSSDLSHKPIPEVASTQEAKQPPTTSKDREGGIDPESVRALFDRQLDLPEGLLFYNPRREFKYWSSEDSHHHSLDEAIAALAAQYGQSREWIEVHMGNSNSLAKIHENLTRASHH